MNIVNEHKKPIDIETWFIDGFGDPIIGWLDYGMCDIGIRYRLFGIIPMRKRIGGVVKRINSICTITNTEYTEDIKAKIKEYEKYSGNSITVYIKHNEMRKNEEVVKKSEYFCQYCGVRILRRFNTCEQCGAPISAV